MDSYEDYIAAIGARIRTLREESSLSLRTFSMMIGVHYNQILLIEQGRANPSVKTLYRIASGFGVDVQDLLPATTHKDLSDPKH